MAKSVKGKKQWYVIVGPSIFRNKELGEVTLAEPEKFTGKKFSVNLMNITNDIKKQNINVYFEATGIKDGKVSTKVIGYEMQPSSMKRLVRRGRNKMSISFVCKTSDNVHVRVKPILVTLSKVSSSITNSLYQNTVQAIARKVAKTSFENLINGLVSRKLQMGWRDEIKKIYPVRVFDIRGIKIDESKKAVSQTVKFAAKPEPEKKEEPEAKEAPKAEAKEEKKEAVKEAPKEEKKEAPAEKPKETPKAEA